MKNNKKNDLNSIESAAGVILTLDKITDSEKSGRWPWDLIYTKTSPISSHIMATG
jgi:hypothetical protein